ncbi:MAG: methyltransferase domain-containing protein [Actinomycetota bacterium]
MDRSLGHFHTDNSRLDPTLGFASRGSIARTLYGPARMKTEGNWAEWLSEGRVRGASANQRKRMNKSLERVRGQVLDRAALRPGQSVLDLGAGEGLLALEARRKVSQTGHVVALDISTDALRVCAARGRRARTRIGALDPVAGDALQLPFASEAFDAVVARSVLMHVSDKQGSIREVARVLRPGGIASVFEAVSTVGVRGADEEAEAIAKTLPDYPRIRRMAWDRDASPMVGWDERDLIRWFTAAGFRSLQMEYRETHVRGGRTITRDDVLRRLAMRPNPSALSHEEAAHALLGHDAPAYLEALSKLLVDRGHEAHHGLVLLSAHR